MADEIEHPYGIINVELIKGWFTMEPGTDGPSGPSTS